MEKLVKLLKKQGIKAELVKKPAFLCHDLSTKKELVHT